MLNLSVRTRRTVFAFAALLLLAVFAAGCGSSSLSPQAFAHKVDAQQATIQSASDALNKKNPHSPADAAKAIRSLASTVDDAHQAVSKLNAPKTMLNNKKALLTSLHNASSAMNALADATAKKDQKGIAAASGKLDASAQAVDSTIAKINKLAGVTNTSSSTSGK